MAQELYGMVENYRDKVFEVRNYGVTLFYGISIEGFPVELLPYYMDHERFLDVAIKSFTVYCRLKG